MKLASAVFLFIFAALSALAAVADEGVIEINQACVDVGCFSGDSAGFPVTLSQFGNYRLTSNLTVPDADTSAISGANGSHLDLNGFAILGPISCSGQPATCSSSGTGNGVSGADEISVSNGLIRGMGGNCLQVGDRSVISNVRMEQCGLSGIAASFGTKALTIADNQIGRNGLHGIDLAYGSAIGTLIANNTIYANAGDGIRGNGSTVLDNIITANGGFGLSANFGGGGTTFGRNTFFENNGGNGNNQTSSGIEISTNVCGGRLTCP